MQKFDEEQVSQEITVADEYLALMSQMEAIGKGYDRKARFVQKYLIAFSLMAGVYTLFQWICIYYKYLINFPGFVLPLMGLAIILPLAYLSYLPMHNTRLLAKKMLGLEDVRGINSMLSLLVDAELRPFAMPVVTRVLKRMSEEEAATIDPWRRRQMRRELAKYGSNKNLSAENTEFAVAILGIMRYVGNNEDVALIRRLARTNPTRRIQDAAASTLPLLEARLKEENNVATLLRAPGSRIIPARPLPVAEANPEQIQRLGASEDTLP